MSGAKKTGQAPDGQTNAKIQRKFDLVFPENKSAKTKDESENVMESKKAPAPQIDLDFSLDEETSLTTKRDDEVIPDENKTVNNKNLDFSLAFSLAGADDEATRMLQTSSATDATSEIEEGLNLDSIDMQNAGINLADATKKTVVINLADLTRSLEESEKALSEIPEAREPSIDLMSNEETKANIESTIKDILRPNFEETVIVKEDDTGTDSGGYHLDKVEDTLLDLGGNTPAEAFNLSESSFILESKEETNPNFSSSDLTSEFSIGGDLDEDDLPTRVNFQIPDLTPAPVAKVQETPMAPAMNNEDSMRFHATIRALREEREDILSQVKALKGENKELEQDNLTLKANLDEAKIEITILRKRHLVELEDLKYRLGMSEEKKAMADEKARQADARREKLEQKVRIDFNQVKQREKELENKLELLSMDVDSQVQSREHKILELRRKIDALEFNMENASIKEQKSLEDKRKLEDRLNKIMKTLRHSIKNLEDDIDHVEEDSDHQKDKS